MPHMTTNSDHLEPLWNKVSMLRQTALHYKTHQHVGAGNTFYKTKQVHALQLTL